MLARLVRLLDEHGGFVGASSVGVVSHRLRHCGHILTEVGDRVTRQRPVQVDDAQCQRRVARTVEHRGVDRDGPVFAVRVEVADEDDVAQLVDLIPDEAGGSAGAILRPGKRFEKFSSASGEGGNSSTA